MKRLPLLLAAALSACVLAPPTLPATSVPSPPPGPRGAADIRFTHVGGDDWLVDYTLPEPVRAVAFARRRIVREAWRIVEPRGAALAGAFVVAREPFTRLRIALRTDTRQPEKEYPPFSRYTDRGLLAYTGQLAIERATCDAADCEAGRRLRSGAEYPATLALVAAEGEGVVVEGRPPAHEARVAMEDDGTIAYFGTLAPVAVASFTGVIDRGLPAWMYERISLDIPRQFALYAERFGPLDGPNPTVLLAYAARADGTSFGGSVLRPHLLALALELGGGALAEDAAMRLRIDRLVAHEAAHFWNSNQHAHSGDPGQAWLHEGSADALAERVLRRTGVLGEVAYREALSHAAAECALWLAGGEPLTASTRPGHTRAFYLCGATFELIAEAAVKRRDPAADLFTLWRAVFAEGQPAYDEATFFGVLDRMTGDPRVSAALRHLVHDPVADPTRALRDALALVGVSTSIPPPGPLPDDYEQHASIPAVDALLPPACVQALVFDGDGGVKPSVGADGACPGLARGDVIDQMAGAPVGSRGATAFRLAAESCQARHVLEVVTSRKNHVTLPCGPRAGSAPAYFQLDTVP